MESDSYTDGVPDNGSTSRGKGTPRRKPLHWRLLLARVAGMSTALAVVLFCTGATAFATSVIYQYHPAVFSGYSWGYAAADGYDNQDAWFNMYPATPTTVDQFCFDITFTYADQQSGSTHFTLTPQVYYGNNILTQIIQWNAQAVWGLDWLKLGNFVPTGTWTNLLSGATTSFDAYWTRSTSGSGTTADPVCFDIAGDLHHTMGLPTGYPTRFAIHMDTADKNDCRRDLGNNSRCYVYYNTGLASQSLGFDFVNLGSTLQRNAVMAGDILGYTQATIYNNGTLILSEIPTSSSSFDFCKGDFFCSQATAVLQYFFYPDSSQVPDFGAIASAISNKPPLGYWNLVKNNITGLATGSNTTLDAVYTATKPFVDPLKAGLGVIVYLAGAYYLYRRFTHIEL